MHLNLKIQHLCIFALVLCFANAQDESSTAASTTSSSSAEIANAPVTTATTSSTSDKPATSSKKYFTAEDFPVCKYSSPELNDCIRMIIEKSIQRVKNGDKELNIPVIDPFRLNRTIFQYSNGNIHGRIILRDGLTYGFSKVNVKKVNLKVNDNKIRMTALSFVPELRIVGNYKAEILLNNVQMKPRGEFNVSLINVTIDQIYEGDFYEADGHRFVRMNKFEAVPKVGDFKLYASGIFPDPTLNELALNIVNQSWRQIFEAFLPETRQYWGPMLLQQFNQIMSVVPYDVFVVD